MDRARDEMSGDVAKVSTRSDQTTGGQESSRITAITLGITHQTESTWESVAKRATASSKHWYSKYFWAKEMAEKRRMQSQEDMEISLKEKNSVMEELRAKHQKEKKAHIAVVKNFEKKIRQMHRTARDQESLIQALQAEIARRDHSEE
jgi:hypothetical protein